MDEIKEMNGHKVQSLYRNQITIVHYVLYLLLINGTNEAIKLFYNLLKTGKTVDMNKTVEEMKIFCAFLSCSLGVLFYSNQSFISEDFLILFIADLVLKFPKVMFKGAKTFTYGVSMACSYVEGYLVHVIPSDGHRYVGFKKNVEKYEQKHGIVFPVRKMFIIINKAMYCPPDLKEFNKENRSDLPYLEACLSLEEIVKDVAGIKGRKYSNSVYCIKRPNRKHVYVVTGTSSPLNTFYNVLKNKLLFDLLSPIDVDEIVEEFSLALRSIIDNSPIYKEYCEIVFFDGKDPKQNLADILLKRVMELETDFENIRRDR